MIRKEKKNRGQLRDKYGKRTLQNVRIYISSLLLYGKEQKWPSNSKINVTKLYHEVSVTEKYISVDCGLEIVFLK